MGLAYGYDSLQIAAALADFAADAPFNRYKFHIKSHWAELSPMIGALVIYKRWEDFVRNTPGWHRPVVRSYLEERPELKAA